MSSEARHGQTRLMVVARKVAMLGESGLSGVLTLAVGDLLAGTVGGLLTATFAVSYATLVFTGPLAAEAPTGIVAMLTACVVTGLGAVVLSSMPFASASPDANTMVILAGVAADVAVIMGPAASPDALAATVLMLLMVAAMLMGAAMTSLSLLRAGRVVRFIPFQVMAGVLGATGWSLMRGGARVAIGGALTGASLTSAGDLSKLTITVVLGAVLLVSARRVRHPLAIPGLLLSAVAIYHAVTWGIGFSVVEQARLGWLMTLPAHLPVRVPWSPSMLHLVDWHALQEALPGLLPVVVMGVITLLLNVNALELATARDASLDTELRAGGVASIISGLIGGANGYIGFSRSLLLLSAGGRTRLAPATCSMIAGFVPLLEPSVLGLVPRPILGGMLFFLGLQLFEQWVIRSWRGLSIPEWLTVLLIVGVTARFGFLDGVIAGVAVGCAHFAVAYSRISPTSAKYRGDIAISNVSRPASDQALLLSNAAEQLVLHLHGFLFFGTANRLLEEVRSEVARTPGQLRFLVLDFANVTGIDSSALLSFTRISQIAAAGRIVQVFTAIHPAIADRLFALPAIDGAPRQVFCTLDEGLEWCEDQRLDELRCEPVKRVLLTEYLARIFGDPSVVSRFLTYLEPQGFAAGETLIRQGASSDDLLFIERGRVSVFAEGIGSVPMRVRTLETGSMIGEMGFILQQPRTATVVADTSGRMLRLTRCSLHRLELDDPPLSRAFHHGLIRLLAERINDKDRLIAALARAAKPAG